MWIRGSGFSAKRRSSDGGSHPQCSENVESIQRTVTIGVVAGSMLVVGSLGSVSILVLRLDVAVDE